MDGNNHQVIHNMLAIKYYINRICECIYPPDNIIASIVWVIIASCCHAVQDTPGQYVSVIYMIFNLKPVCYWHALTSRNNQQSAIYCDRKKLLESDTTTQQVI